MKKLQVFVSSTYTDLLEERQAAVEAILECGHIPAGMELFTAGNKSQLETIYNWIDECDVYCLILGGRYGSIDDETGLSYTELEYEYAKSKGKPFFSMVIKEEELERRIKERGTSVSERREPKALEAFRNKVLSAVCSFFSDYKDIKLTVHKSLSAYARDPSLPGWVSGREVMELDVLRKENLELKLKLGSTQPSQAASRPRKVTVYDNADNFDTLDRVLSATSIIVPKECFDPPLDDDKHSNLKSELLRFKTTLVTGVYSSATAGYGRFLYHRLMPLLQIHGLSDNEKPSGSSFRRSYLNKEGMKYLAWLAQKELAPTDQ